MDYKEVLNTMREFRARQKQIAEDANLSLEGKRRAEERLKNEIDAYYPQALDSLRAAWRAIRDRYSALEKDRQAEEKAVSDNWDYQKLNYENMLMTQRLQEMRSLQELAEFYRIISRSGNRERVRALAELAPTVIRSRFAGEIGAGSLAKSIEKDASAMLDSERLRALRAQYQALIQQAVELSETTAEVEDFYKPRINVLFDTDWHNITQGVLLSARGDPETLGITYTLEVDE